MNQPRDPQDGPAPADEPGGGVRSRAEARLRDRVLEAVDPADRLQVERLMHELGVHQIELEMQNEQLVLTQAALETAHDRYRDLFEHAPFGYLSALLDGRVVQANRRAAVLFGLTAERLTSRRVADLVAPESWPDYQQRLRALLRDREAQSFELRALTAGGGRRWLAVEMLLGSAGDDGGPQLRLALADIDERVAQRERLAQLAAIVASSQDAIIGRDRAGRVTAWNAAATRLFGFDEREMLGRDLGALMPPERAGEDAELLHRLRAGEPVAALETEWLRRDGTRLPVLLSLSPIVVESGAVAGSALIVRDISERKQHERALHRRMRQLDLLSQVGQLLIAGAGSSDDSLAELFDRVRLAIGCELCLVARLDAPEAGLRTVAVRGVAVAAPQVAADLAALHQPLIAAAAARGAPLVIEGLPDSPLAEAEGLRAIGLCAFAAFPLVVQAAVHGVVAFSSTTHRQFREGDLQLAQTVCDQVSAMLERTRLVDELQRREAALREADRAKDDFIATLAHELRNPLAPIRNAVAIMRQGDLADTPIAWSRDVIERQVLQMTRLLEGLLDVSRITRNKIELRRERIDLMRAVEQAVETARPLLDAQRHQLRVDGPEQPIAVYADMTRLTQVFANLLANAAKYTDAGGRIELRVARAGDEAVVAVRDSGIGIDAAQLAHVFDMFSQLAPALERSRGGLGIGLSLARGLVELHGGRIEAASDGPGRGSEFRVRLPLMLAAAGAEPPQGAGDAGEAAPRTARHRVLVADDNADAARTLAAVLEQHGHEVRTALGGEQALDLAADWRPDVAVVDIGMPDLNGYEVARRLRGQPWGESIVLIACTGWGQAEDRRRASAAGFDHHVVKPVEVKDVLELVAGSPSGGG